MPPSPFSFLDYLLLFAYLLVMVSIGVWVGRGQKDTREYFLAGRSMGWFPLGISTIASLYSAISYMGTPSEYFTHGAKFAVQMLAAFPSAVVVIFVFMPFYHRLQVYTAYEYLEKRFSVTVRSSGQRGLRPVADPVDGHRHLCPLPGAAHGDRIRLD